MAAIVATTGCNNSPYTATASGKVMVDGVPLTKGQVVFHPAAKGPLAYAYINSNGKYEIRTASSDGLIPGEYTATVLAFEKEPWDGITAAQLEEIRLVPARYSQAEKSDLKGQIEPGENQWDLELTTK